MAASLHQPTDQPTPDVPGAKLVKGKDAAAQDNDDASSQSSGDAGAGSHTPRMCLMFRKWLYCALRSMAWVGRSLQLHLVACQPCSTAVLLLHCRRRGPQRRHERLLHADHARRDPHRLEEGSAHQEADQADAGEEDTGILSRSLAEAEQGGGKGLAKGAGSSRS